MTVMCSFFGISRAAYYTWVKRQDQPDPDIGRMKLVEEAYLASKKTYGYRRIHLWIKQYKGITINHKTVLRLMRKLGIRSIARRRRPHPTGEEIGSLHRYPNVLNRDFSARQPNQKWVTDISHIPVKNGWAYLSTIKDLFDGFIVAHQVARHKATSLVTATLKQAKQKEKVTDGLILHSDQGRQYCSNTYFVLTQDYKVIPSMSRPGNCWDNAPMESFFSHLKEEAIRHIKSPTFMEVKHIIDEYIYFYNYERIQLKTKQTPYQRRCQYFD